MALAEWPTTAGKMGRAVLLALNIYAALFIVLLLLSLYGFLVKSNEYPLIDLKPEQAGALPAKAFVLGHSESHSLLYWPEGPEAGGGWWIDKTAHLPALQRQPVDLFEYVASKEPAKEGGKFMRVADKQGAAE